MDKNKIIIIGLVIVIVALVAGLALMMQSPAKEDTKLTITSAKSFEEGSGKLSVKLVDLNGTPLKNKDVDVLIVNKKGKVVKNESINTNKNGKAKLSLDLKKGKYTVEVSFAGDENYTNSSDVQKLKIKEKEVVEEPVETQSTSEASSYEYDSNGIAESSEFYDDDIAGGQNVKQNVYEDGDAEHYYEDGSYDYYDVQTGKTYYMTADGEYGVDDPNNKPYY